MNGRLGNPKSIAIKRVDDLGKTQQFEVNFNRILMNANAKDMILKEGDTIWARKNNLIDEKDYTGDKINQSSNEYRGYSNNMGMHNIITMVPIVMGKYGPGNYGSYGYGSYGNVSEEQGPQRTFKLYLPNS